MTTTVLLLLLLLLFVTATLTDTCYYYPFLTVTITYCLLEDNFQHQLQNLQFRNSRIFRDSFRWVVTRWVPPYKAHIRLV